MQNLLPHCRNLRALYPTQYDEENEDDPPLCGMIVGARPSPIAKYGWKFKSLSLDGKIENENLLEADLDADWRGLTCWDEFLESLTKMKKLESLDCILQLVLPAKDHMPEAPSQGTTATAYQQRKERFEKRILSSDIVHGGLDSAMKAAAQIMVDCCPSLRRGFFWCWLIEDGWDDADRQCKRWTWATNKTLNGGREITVEPVVEGLTTRWMSNNDGTGGRIEDEI